MKTQITNLLMLATAFLATEIVRAQNLTDNLKKGELLYQNSLTSKTDAADWTMEGPGVIEFKEGWMEMYSPDETTMNKIYSHRSTIIIFMGVPSNTFKNKQL